MATSLSVSLVPAPRPASPPLPSTSKPEHIDRPHRKETETQLGVSNLDGPSRGRRRASCANPFTAVLDSLAWASQKVSDAFSAAQTLFSDFAKTDTGRATLTFAPTAAGLVIKVASDSGLIGPSTRTAATIIIMTAGLASKVFNKQAPSEAGIKASMAKDTALWAQVLRTGVVISGASSEPTVKVFGLGMKVGALALHAATVSKVDPSDRPVSFAKQSAHILGGLADTLDDLGVPVGVAGRVVKTFSDNLYLTDSMSTAYHVPAKGFALSSKEHASLREDPTPLYGAALMTALGLPALMDAPKEDVESKLHGRRMEAEDDDRDLTLVTCDGTSKVTGGGGSNMTESVSSVTGRLEAQGTDSDTTSKADAILNIEGAYNNASAVITNTTLTGDIPDTAPTKAALLDASTRQGTRLSDETGHIMEEAAADIAQHYGIGRDRTVLPGDSTASLNLDRIKTVFDGELKKVTDGCEAAIDDSGDYDDEDICDAIGRVSFDKDSLLDQAQETGRSMFDAADTFTAGVEADAAEQFRAVAANLGDELDIERDQLESREHSVTLTGLKAATTDAATTFQTAPELASNLKAKMRLVVAANSGRVLRAQENLNTALTLQANQRARLADLFSSPPNAFECGLENSGTQIGLAAFSFSRGYMEVHIPCMKFISRGALYGRFNDKITAARFVITSGERGGVRTARIVVTKTNRHTGHDRERGKEVVSLEGTGLNSTSKLANRIVTLLRALSGASVQDAFKGEKELERSQAILLAARRQFQPGGEV
jgi:hypothetical protein